MSYKIHFLNVKEVAEALGCSATTARNIMLRPDFPLVQVGRSLKVEKHAFLKWAKEKRL